MICLRYASLFSISPLVVMLKKKQIATQLNDQVLQGGTADYVWPKNNDPLVMSWQDTFNKAYVQACSIYSTAKSMPGNPPNGVKSQKCPFSPSWQADKTTVSNGLITSGRPQLHQP